MYACLLIPAYQPNNVLLDMICEIKEKKKLHSNIVLTILVVNDGSTSKLSQQVFSRLENEYSRTHVLTLKKNCGKGAALKAGFKHIQNKFPLSEWIVTADADGQHLPKDIWSILDAETKNEKIILGVRKFDANMPLRSYLGNVVTKHLFKLIHGLDISDTQTGLRGFNKDWLSKLLNIPYNGYDYEIEALAQMAKTQELVQIPISCVYEIGNPTSHFNPFFDTIKIFAVLLRHILRVF